jgi:diamine N-acetyltransferase
MNARPALQIRTAVAGDAETLSRNMAQWFLDAYAHSSTPDNVATFVTANFAPEKQARELADPSIATLLVEDGGVMVGYAQLRFATSPPACITEADALELGRFYFAPSHHGSGGAAQLMQALREVARARGRRWLWLLVWQEKPQAIRFYEKQGFEKAGTAVFMVGDDRKADWVMRAPVGLD